MAKSQRPSFDQDWSTHTVIDRSELENHIFKVDEKTKDKITLHNFCIEMGNGTFNLSQLMGFVEKKFPYFVLTEKEVREAEYPYKTALDRVDYKNLSWQDGTYGELLLFLLVDGILDIPMICHKISIDVDPRQNVKGSDGIFFGEFRENEALALGEAKMYGDLEDGIDKGLESSYRFHGERAESQRHNELFVASKNLSDNLSSEKIEYLAETLVDDQNGIPYIHPIFIAFQSEAAVDIPKKDSPPHQIKNDVLSAINSIDKRDYIADVLKEDWSPLAHHHLIFLLLPVADVSQLRDRMKNTIFPHSSLHE